MNLLWIGVGIIIIKNKSTEMYKNYILRLVSAFAQCMVLSVALVRKTWRMKCSAQRTNCKQKFARRLRVHTIKSNTYFLLSNLLSGDVGDFLDRQPDFGIG